MTEPRSARIGPSVSRRTTEDVLVLVLGLGLLLARPALAGSRGSSAPLVATFACVLALAVAAGIPRDERRAGSAWAIAVGVGAVGLARLWAAPGIPLPVSPTVVALNIVAAVSEEAFFRGFLYGRLVRYGAPAAVTISAVAFAAIHVPVYGLAAFWVDLGAGLLLGWQRWASGGWASPAVTHVAANLVAVIP